MYNPIANPYLSCSDISDCCYFAYGGKIHKESKSYLLLQLFVHIFLFKVLNAGASRRTPFFVSFKLGKKNSLSARSLYRRVQNILAYACFSFTVASFIN